MSYELLTVGGLFGLWVLLPLIPSILIFLIFPMTTIMTRGPLALLTLRAGAAFVAYLIVFAAGYPIVQTMIGKVLYFDPLNRNIDRKADQSTHMTMRSRYMMTRFALIQDP